MKSCVIKRTDIRDGIRVSTARVDDGAVFYETAIISEKPWHCADPTRYATRKEALADHDRIVKLCVLATAPMA